jgi:N-acetylneuraminate lyase
MKIQELVAAAHTPFHADGSLNLSMVEKQAEHLLHAGVTTVFIGGSTGESHSLTLDERRALAMRWSEVARTHAPLRVIVHVGSNCISDARMLAAQAQELKAAAISALAPSYFKPRSVDVLVDCCREIAAAAPGLPFYYYDIPSMTGVTLPSSEFLCIAGVRIPTLAGIKFTNADLTEYQRCLHAGDGRFDLPWGTDEYLLAALAVGAAGAVGSTYNFAAPLQQRMWDAFKRGDLAAARMQQFRLVRVIGCLGSFGYMGAAKTVMSFLGVEVGPARLPNSNLSSQQRGKLRQELETMGFFQWVKI